MVERQYTRVGEYRIHSAHSGSGPPVILLHGLSGSQGWWRYTMAELAREFSVVAPELVGFGRTSKPRVVPGLTELAEITAEWAAQMGIRTASVVGHSMGGQIAIHLAADHPELVSRLVLVAPAGIPRELHTSALFRLGAELIPPRRWGRLRFLPTIALDAARAGPRVLLIALQKLLADDVRPLLPRLTQPTLLIWGALDPLVPLSHGEMMNELLPDSRLVVLENAAHNPMVDRPAEFNEALLAFLRDV